MKKALMTFRDFLPVIEDLIYIKIGQLSYTEGPVYAELIHLQCFDKINTNENA